MFLLRVVGVVFQEQIIWEETNLLLTKGKHFYLYWYFYYCKIDLYFDDFYSLHIFFFIFVHLSTSVQLASLQTNERKYFNCCFPAALAFLNFVALFLCLEKSSSGDTLKLLIPSKTSSSKVHE